MTARGSLGFSAAAVALVATLIANYVVSQFLRNSIGVIAPNLAQELLLTPAQIGLLSSMFFFLFAAIRWAWRLTVSAQGSASVLEPPLPSLAASRLRPLQARKV